ncbi:hypothetical protein GCM10023235_34320 [Kitasatospora terrestris]|uniref:Uncharacterized protein n=1 Tax=Kitasatospora terrestris TaxID=258051 RepID=A0ABP9DNF0_9ACTN
MAVDGREVAGASFRTGGYTGLPEAELWTGFTSAGAESTLPTPRQRGRAGGVRPGENNALCNDSYTLWSKWSDEVHFLRIFTCH